MPIALVRSLIPRSHSCTSSFRKSYCFYLQNTSQSNHVPPPRLLPWWAKPPPPLPGLWQQLLAGPPTFSLFSTQQPGGPVTTRSHLITVGSKLSRGSLLHLEPNPRPPCGSPGLPQSASNPKRHLLSDLLFSCVHPEPACDPRHTPTSGLLHVLFCPMERFSLPCPHGSLTPQISSAVTHIEPSLTTLFKTAAIHPTPPNPFLLVYFFPIGGKEEAMSLP